MTKAKPSPDEPVEEPVEDKPRKDPWKDPCPVCGLLGCRRHAP